MIFFRCDLNPKNGIFTPPAYGHSAGGAYDAKLTNSSLAKQLNFVAVSGPTTGTNLPTFKWSKSGFVEEEPHLGLPDEWNFEPITTEWILNVKNDSN